ATLNFTQEDLSRIEDRVKAYEALAKQYVDRPVAGDKLAAEPVIKAGSDLREEVDKLDTLIADSIDRLTDQADRQRTWATEVAWGWTGLSLTVSFVLLGAVLSALRPITALTDHVQRLGRGERPRALDVRGGDEIAMLAREFDGMVAALRVR